GGAVCALSGIVTDPKRVVPRENLVPYRAGFFIFSNYGRGGCQMIIVVEKNASRQQVDHIVRSLEEKGVRVHYSEGVDKTILGLIGDKPKISELPVERYPGVEKVVHVSEPFKLASRSFHPEPSRIQVGN